MAAEPVSLVTPDGVRDGDPAALSGLTERRGAAVLAYATWVAAPGEAVAAAAEAFARFRAAVVVAEDPATVDPERTLLRGTRYASALKAPVEVPLRIRLRGAGGAAAPCALVPELLAARAERELSEPDRIRLVRHLSRCTPCRAAEARFRAGEHAYRDAPDQPPPPDAAREIMRALLAAAPRTATSAPTLRVVGDAEAEGAHVPTSEAATPAPDVDRLDENLAPTTEFDALAFATEPRYAERITPVLLPTPEPTAEAVAEPAAAEPALPAEPEPAEDRQATYEFDAIPADAFESSLVPIAPEPSWLGTAARVAAVLIVLAVLAVVALAVTGVVTI